MKKDKAFERLDIAATLEAVEPWEPQILKVMPEECANCLLGQNPLVEPGVIDHILEGRNDDHRAFTCHLSTIALKPRCCFLFFEQNRSLVVRLAKINGWFEYKGIGRDHAKDR